MTEFQLTQEQINRLDKQECEIICGQDHYWHIYSNTLDAFLVSPEFKTEQEALDYEFQTTDAWTSDDIDI